MKPPRLHPDGTCPACIGGWMCKAHQEQTQREWLARWQAVRSSYDRWRINEPLFTMLTATGGIIERDYP